MILEDEVRYYEWVKNGLNEDEMAKRHRQGWQTVIEAMTEKNLVNYNILDFGCNRGGFLKYLYPQKPFKAATGIDLGENSIKIANANSRLMPIKYLVSGSPEELKEKFNLAFSLSVLYLISDLKQHAKKIKQALTVDGVYYATYTDYRNNPSKEYFMNGIAADSVLEPHLYTINEIAEAFFEANFRVSVQKLQPKGFIKLMPSYKYMLCHEDEIASKYDTAYLFRCSL